MGGKKRKPLAAVSASPVTPRSSLLWTTIPVPVVILPVLFAALVWFVSISTQQEVIRAATRVTSESLGSEELKSKAGKYFKAAASFHGASGQGNKGWLFLLAAYDLFPDEDIVLNLVNNYVNANYWYMAFDELFALRQRYPEFSSVAKRLESQISAKLQGQEKDKFRRYQVEDNDASGLAKSLQEPRVLLPFSTAVSQFDLVEQYPDLETLNEEFYEAVIRSYLEMKQSIPSNELSKLSATDLNHRYFKWQMDILRNTGSYWSGFTELSLFTDLIELMREGAVKVLKLHGMDDRLARKKAHHDIIFWASVHTGESIHEPHMTEDSLLGGVYYVSVPKHSGKLELFDPRSGFQTTCDNSFKDLVNPPYHRTHLVTPKEGLMVIFPGWLVHSVKPSKGLNVKLQKYRVSISVNLKGEWQDTTNLHFELR